MFSSSDWTDNEIPDHKVSPAESCLIPAIIAKEYPARRLADTLRVLSDPDGNFTKERNAYIQTSILNRAAGSSRYSVLEASQLNTYLTKVHSSASPTNMKHRVQAAMSILGVRNNSLQWHTGTPDMNTEILFPPGTATCSGEQNVCRDSEEITEVSFKQFRANLNYGSEPGNFNTNRQLLATTSLSRNMVRSTNSSISGSKAMKINFAEVIRNQSYNTKKSKKMREENGELDDDAAEQLIEDKRNRLLQRRVKYKKAAVPVMGVTAPRMGFVTASEELLNQEAQPKYTPEVDETQTGTSSKRQRFPREKFNTRPKQTVPDLNSRLDKVAANNEFITAGVELVNQDSIESDHTVTESRRHLQRRSVSGKFVSPVIKNDGLNAPSTSSTETHTSVAADAKLKNIEPRMVELIRSEIMEQANSVKTSWTDIAGLQFAKSVIQEAVVWPMLRPDIFTGLRRPPKGILLFGPPGTGKTLIGKCVASQSGSTFFSISASSLTSKWVGEGEKMVRALFAVAQAVQPSVIFIDEIDSLLSQRSDSEHESSRRIKNEFLIQLDGTTTSSDDRILLIGATNRPHELDEAARRRFTKRLYIPLPEKDARLELFKKLMITESHSLSESNFDEVADMSEGYSGADIRNVCADALFGPIRSIDVRQIASIDAKDVRPVIMVDFLNAFKRIRSSVSASDLATNLEWDKSFGSGV